MRTSRFVLWYSRLVVAVRTLSLIELCRLVISADHHGIATAVVVRVLLTATYCFYLGDTTTIVN